jgi:hypothetical protein
MKSLAEHLGVKIEAGLPAQDAPELDPEQFSARDFARMVLCSYEYRRNVFMRVASDSLPPQVEVLLYHYAAGKPVERIEVEDKTPNATNMSKADIMKRIALLQSLVQELPEDESTIH